MERDARKSELFKLIGWNLKRLRLRRGWSQEALALEGGMDTAYLSRIERGAENPTVSALDGLAVALEVDLIELLHPKKPGMKPLANLKAGRKVDPNSKRQKLLRTRRRD